MISASSTLVAASRRPALRQPSLAHRMWCSPIATSTRCTARAEARLANAVHDVCSTLELDWHDEPEETLVGAFDVVLASDLFYEDDSLEPLSRLLPKLVRPGGTLLCCLPVESEFRARRRRPTKRRNRACAACGAQALTWARS